MPSVSSERISPVFGSNTSTPFTCTRISPSPVVLDVDVRLAEHDEEVALAGVLQLVRHVQVGVHPRLQDRQRAEPRQFGGVGVEVEGAGDQHVEARLGRLARGGDEIGAGDGAEFRADEDARRGARGLAFA